MISVRGLTKDYGKVRAVEDLSFDVPDGVVTGFLGPNGAGKSTTLRMIVGLDRPTAGTATINGHPYGSIKKPLHQVGVLLDAKAVHPNRSAAAHLKWVAQSNGIGVNRVEEVLGLVGLSDVAGRKVGGFSLGMGQRLGLATAMLGDPHTLILDEPVNGLDPEGIVWVRNFLKALAAEGRTIFVSSHLLSEMAQTAQNLVVIGRGRLVADTTVEEFTRSSGGSEVVVRVDPEHVEAMRQVVAQENLGGGESTDAHGRTVFSFPGQTTDMIGAVCYSYGVMVVELTEHSASLEEAFMQSTGESRQFTAGTVTQEH